MTVRKAGTPRRKSGEDAAESARGRAPKGSGSASAGDKKLKSAWEIALERMQDDGLDAPEDLPTPVLERMAAIRSEAEARLAQLEILSGGVLEDSSATDEQKTEYRRERQRIEDERDRKLRAARRGEPADG